MNKIISMKRSLAKLVLLTSAMGFIAGCTDYLNDFEEKYDDGEAFSEQSHKDGNSSSDSQNTELSSSSVKDDSSIRCTGATIYDARYPDSLGLGFKYSYNDKIIDIKTISSKEGLTLPYTSGVDFGRFVLDKDYSSFDASSWGGLCIEYKPVHSAVMVSVTGPDNEAIYKNLPRDSNFVELKWDATDWGSLQGESPKTFDFKHVNSIAIGVESKPTITRLTILKSGITSAVEPFSSSNSVAFDNKACSGDIIYDEATGSSVGLGFTDGAKKTGATFSVNTVTTAYYYPLYNDGSSIIAYDATEWDGICIEYTATENFSVGIRYSSIYERKYTRKSNVIFPKTDNVQSKTYLWTDFEGDYDLGPIMASAASLIEFSTDNNQASDVKISRITTAKAGSAQGSAPLKETPSIKIDTLNWYLNDISDNSIKGMSTKQACQMPDDVSSNDSIVYSFNDANSICENLGDGWRLPTELEWRALFYTFDNTKYLGSAKYTYYMLTRGKSTNNQGFCNFQGESCRHQVGFWSSEGYLFYFKNDNSETPILSLFTNNGSDISKAYAKVRCVKPTK